MGFRVRSSGFNGFVSGDTFTGSDEEFMALVSEIGEAALSDCDQENSSSSDFSLSEAESLSSENQFKLEGSYDACTSMALNAAISFFEGEELTSSKIDDCLAVGAACHRVVTEGKGQKIDSIEAMDGYNRFNEGSKFFMDPLEQSSLINDKAPFDFKMKKMLEGTSFLINGKTSGVLTAALSEKSFALAVTKEGGVVKKIEFFDSHGELISENNHGAAYVKVFLGGTEAEIICSFSAFLERLGIKNDDNRSSEDVILSFYALKKGQDSDIGDASVEINNAVSSEIEVCEEVCPEVKANEILKPKVVNGNSQDKKWSLILLICFLFRGLVSFFSSNVSEAS